MTQTISLSLAQYTMLGRILRGAKLPTSRYHHATINALARKGCVAVHHAHWRATDTGKRVHACRGILRAGLHTWDGATRAERDAFKAVYWYHDVRDQDVVEKANRLYDRIAVAGERAGT
jgi:hypothetical protein